MIGCKCLTSQCGVRTAESFSNCVDNTLDEWHTRVSDGRGDASSSSSSARDSTTARDCTSTSSPLVSQDEHGEWAAGRSTTTTGTRIRHARATTRTRTVMMAARQS